MFKSFKILTVLLVSASLTQQLLADCCCPPTIMPISSVPFTITQSNTTYCITNNLLYTGASGTPAITVNAGVQDIIIDFNGYDLTLGTTLATNQVGIQMLGTTASPVSNVTIKNGTIQSAAPSTNGANNAINLTAGTSAVPSLMSFNRVLVENMVIKDTFRGVVVLNQTDIAIDLTVRNCEFNQTGAGGLRGVNCSTIQGLVVEDCIFTQPNSTSTAYAILLTNNIINCLIQRNTINVGGSGMGIFSFNNTPGTFLFQ